MRFLKNFLSLVCAVTFSLGVAMTVAPMFNDDLPALGIVGIPLVIQAISISILMSLAETKENRIVAIVFFWVNGFMIFACFTVILIPFMIIVKKLLPDAFVQWKLNTLSRRVAPDEVMRKRMTYLSLTDIQE